MRPYRSTFTSHENLPYTLPTPNVSMCILTFNPPSSNCTQKQNTSNTHGTKKKFGPQTLPRRRREKHERTNERKHIVCECACVDVTVCVLYRCFLSSHHFTAGRHLQKSILIGYTENPAPTKAKCERSHD